MSTSKSTVAAGQDGCSDPITVLAEQVGISPDDTRRILVAAQDDGMELRPDLAAALAAAAHYHVFAVQDWGGSQERWTGEDTPMSRDAARKHADDMARADHLVYGDHGSIAAHERAMDEAEREYGDRLRDLTSGNICPGWEAIWIRACAEPCRFDDLFSQAKADAYRPRGERPEPYWPAGGDQHRGAGHPMSGDQFEDIAPRECRARTTS